MNRQRAAILGVLVLLLGAAAPVAFAQQNDGVTIGFDPVQQSADVGDTVTYDIVVQNADTVGAAEADIELTDPSVATITDISLSGTDAASNPLAAATVGPDGESASFAVAYGNDPLEGDGSAITVATVTVEGTAAGETALQLSGVAVGNDAGASYAVASVTDATLTVGDFPQPTTEAPTTEAPPTEEPPTEEPTTEEPTTEDPTTAEPSTEEPTTEGPTTEQPTTEVPTTEQPTTEAPTTEAPTTEAPTTEVPTTEGPTTEEPTTEKPTDQPTEEPATEEPTTEQPTTEEPTTEEPTAEAPADETYYQVDFVVGEPKEQVGPEGGFYSDENRLIRFAHGVDSEQTRGGSVPTLDADVASCLDAGYVTIHGDNTATVRFTVEEGCELTLSLVSYEKPGPDFDRSVTQDLVDSSTDSFGPGEYTLTVDLPASQESEDDDSALSLLQSARTFGSIAACGLVGLALARRN